MYPKWFSEQLLQKNPANRPIERLNTEQRDAFMKLILRSECSRSPHQLWDAGIVRPCLTFEEFKQDWYDMRDEYKTYYLSDVFLEKWLVEGYISKTDLPDITHKSSGYVHDYRNIINMSCAVVEDSNCFLDSCYLPYAQFDNIDFYKAFIEDCTLEGATAYGSYFEDCNGYRDADWIVYRHLVECGMIGINPDFLRSDESLNDDTDSEYSTNDGIESDDSSNDGSDSDSDDERMNE